MINYLWSYESKTDSSFNSRSSSGGVKHLTKSLKKILSEAVGHEGAAIKVLCDSESAQECHDFFDGIDYAGLTVEYTNSIGEL